MVELMETLKEAPMKVAEQTCQRVFDLMMLHLARSELAGIAFVPKYHFSMHLVDRLGAAHNMTGEGFYGTPIIPAPD
eukprot:5830056-Pyramimonas_sp.AAC.1